MDKDNHIPKRVVVLHGHVFKNAGTTFDWSLKRSFDKGFVDHRDDTSMRLGHDYLKPYILENPGIKVISSHHMQFPAPELNDVEVIPAILLRHPIERIKSVYNFERIQNPDTVGAIAAKEKSFSDYVHWRMQAENGPTIRDFQVRYCTRVRVDKNIPVSETRFKEALAFLLNTPLVGIVERYDESMVVFEDYLKALIPDIDLSYIPQNVSEKSLLPLDQRIEAVLNNLDADTKRLVLLKNNYDLKLYENSIKELDKRIVLIEQFDIKLLNFRRRCKQLAQPEAIEKHWLQRLLTWNTAA